MKGLDKPAQAVHSNYYAQVDEDICVACGACAERCHMDAIIVNDIQLKPYKPCEYSGQITSNCSINFRTRFITCGLLGEDGEIWDENGARIAISRQIAQYRTHTKNEDK